MTTRVGVLGGTFDPIHAGHLAVAAAARDCARLDRVLLVPAARPPHRGPTGASASDRLAMAGLACQGHPWLQVWDGELSRPGRSYTVDTLAELAVSLSGADLFLVLGWDAARELPTWHRPRAVLELATIILLNRPGLAEPTEADLARAGIDPDRIVRCAARTPDVSATALRRLLAAGGDPGGALAAPVVAYIEAHRLYTGTDSG